jgi:hypothetical protein
MLLAAIPQYCQTPPPHQSIPNAYISTPVQTVNSLTYFTCLDGYMSSGVSTNPYYSCNAYNSSAGAWSAGVTFSCETFTGYCNSTAPSLTNANTPTPQTYIGAKTYFTCDLGYVSSLSPAAPYYQCDPSTNTTGTWSPLQGACNVIAPYCNSSTAPSISNANSPTPQTQVTQQTTFTCASGYTTSSTGGTSPYYTCNTLNSTMGQWSAVTYGCILIPNYCPSDPSINSKPLTAPSGSFGLTLWSVVSLVCPTGYVWVSTSGSLSVRCLVSSATAGVWSTAAGYCIPQSTATSTTPTTPTSTTSGTVLQWWFYVLVSLCGALIVVVVALSIGLIFYCIMMKKYSHNGIYSRSSSSVRPLSKY